MNLSFFVTVVNWILLLWIPEDMNRTTLHTVHRWGSPSNLFLRSQNGSCSHWTLDIYKECCLVGQFWFTLNNSKKFHSTIACNKMSPPHKEWLRQATLNFTNRLSDNLALSIHDRESSSKQTRQAVSFDICSCFSTWIILLGYPVFSCFSMDAIS